MSASLVAGPKAVARQSRVIREPNRNSRTMRSYNELLQCDVRTATTLIRDTTVELRVRSRGPFLAFSFPTCRAEIRAVPWVSEQPLPSYSSGFVFPFNVFTPCGGFVWIFYSRFTYKHSFVGKSGNLPRRGYLGMITISAGSE